MSMILYLFSGLAGFPFFSGSVAGLAILRSPTIGYIIGFFIAAQIIGNMSQKPILGIGTGTLAIYICGCLLYTSPSPRDVHLSRMPSSA